MPQAGSGRLRPGAQGSCGEGAAGTGRQRPPKVQRRRAYAARTLAMNVSTSEFSRAAWLAI